MTLPPGFRFHPTDLELVGYYLRRRVNNVHIEFDVIADVDLYKCEPWDLPSQSLLPSNDLEWFFFSPRDRKYPNGSRTNRATEAGYWKATGRDRTVKAATKASKTLGMKKTLVFYRGRAPHGERTDWLMHEYRLEGDDPETMQMSQDAYVLCRVFKKNGFESRSPEDNPQDEMNDNADSPPANYDVFQEHDVKPTLHLPAQPLVAQPLSVPNYMPTVKPQLDLPEEYNFGMSKFVLDDDSFNQMIMPDSDIFSICPSSLDTTGTEPESLPQLRSFESPDITKKTFNQNWQQLQPQVDSPWSQPSRLPESYLNPKNESGLYGDIDQQLPFLVASPPSAGSPESSLLEGEGVAETPSQFIQIRPRLPLNPRSSNMGPRVSGLPAVGNWRVQNRCLLEKKVPIPVVKNVSPSDVTPGLGIKSEEEAAVSDVFSKTSESVSPEKEEKDDAQSPFKPDKEEAEQLNAVAGDPKLSLSSTEPANVESECVGEVDLPPSQDIITVSSPCRSMSSDEPSEGIVSVHALSHVSNLDETSVMSPAICEAVQESNIHPGNENVMSSGTDMLERAYEASATETPGTEEARNESKVSSVQYGCPVAVEGTRFELVGADCSPADAIQSKLGTEGTKFELIGSDYSSADANQSKLGTGGLGSIHVNAVTTACSCDKFASQPHKQAVSCKCYSRSRKACSSQGAPGSWEKAQEKGAELPGHVDVAHKLKGSKKAFVGVFFLGAISTCVGFFAWQSIFSVVRQLVGSSLEIISAASDL